MPSLSLTVLLTRFFVDSAEDQERIRESIRTTRKPKRPPGPDLPPLPTLPAVERKRKRDADPTPSTSRGSSVIRGAGPSSSQANAGEEEENVEGGEENEEELYTVLATQVVGTKYYTGLVGLGEQVNLVREPTNRFDHNAIKVTNISNIQV
jgi:SWI/SNF-related matrix-associated actin-dependent regulator of chromatin subfamily A3